VQIDVIENGKFLTMREIRVEAVKAALRHCDGDVRKVATLLDIGRSTIYRMNEEFKIF
jgi:transcriptional regulator of acetoin/glycerol metabolism